MIRLEIRRITNVTDIYSERVFKKLHEDLDIRKLTGQRVMDAMFADIGPKMYSKQHFKRMLGLVQTRYKGLFALIYGY